MCVRPRSARDPGGRTAPRATRSFTISLVSAPVCAPWPGRRPRRVTPTPLISTRLFRSFSKRSGRSNRAGDPDVMIGVARTTKRFPVLARYLVEERTDEAEGRVAWVASRNLPTDDPVLGARVIGAARAQHLRATG